jgi:hypothetical protein
MSGCSSDAPSSASPKPSTPRLAVGVEMGRVLGACSRRGHRCTLISRKGNTFKSWPYLREQIALGPSEERNLGWGDRLPRRRRQGELPRSPVPPRMARFDGVRHPSNVVGNTCPALCALCHTDNEHASLRVRKRRHLGWEFIDGLRLFLSSKPD